jgi:hypothetical membrane protein
VNVTLVRIGGFFGVAVPLLGFVMIFLAIGESPWFSWTDNALSDLGVEGFGSVIFNGGLAMTGSLAMMFFVGLYEFSVGSIVGRVGALLFLAGTFLLVGIGVFNETYGPIHLYISVAFFFSLALSILISGAFMLRRRMIGLGFLSLLTGAIAAIVWLMPWRGTAIPETISALAAGIWSSVLGAWMLRLK